MRVLPAAAAKLDGQWLLALKGSVPFPYLSLSDESVSRERGRSRRGFRRVRFAGLHLSRDPGSADQQLKGSSNPVFVPFDNMTNRTQ